MKQRSNAFTIVELLIVIVVIGILAAISIVAYNNIQQNARNSATSQAVSQWVRILNMYKADRGNFPTVASCLGDSSVYGHGFSGKDSSGAQCRQDLAGHAGFTVNPAFVSQVSEYISGPGPTPAIVPYGSAGVNPWYRGAYYHPAYTGSPARIDFIVQGVSSDCPEIGGADRVDRSSPSSASNSVRCIARLEPTP